MSFVNRQLYKQKPQAWGPVSSVQASIFKNAERIGIDPASIALAMPMWGPWNQLDYSKNNRIFTPGSGVTFSKNSLKTTNDANGVIDLGSTFSPNNVNNFTVIQSCKINTIDSFSLSSRTSSLTGGFEFLIGGGSTYGNVNLRYTDTEVTKTSATATGLNDGRYHQLTALLDSTNNTATFMVDSNIIDASLFIFGSITNTQNLFIDKRGTTYRAGDHNYLWIASAIWTTSQIAYLSDNPYYLLHRVPPVFYSVPGGSIGLYEASTSWLINATIERDSQWRINSDSSLISKWRVFEESKENTSWDIYNSIVYKEYTSWSIFNSLSNDSSWKILKEENIETAWSVFISNIIQTQWSILSGEKISAATAWGVYNQLNLNTDWRLMALQNALTEWKIQTKEDFGVAWDILAKADVELEYRISEQLQSYIRWRIGDTALESKGVLYGWDLNHDFLNDPLIYDEIQRRVDGSNISI